MVSARKASMGQYHKKVRYVVHTVLPPSKDVSQKNRESREEATNLSERHLLEQCRFTDTVAPNQSVSLRVYQL